MTDFVVTCFKPVFEAMGLASQPGSLADVSQMHLKALADVMDTLHDALPRTINPGIKMAVPLASLRTMRPGHRPDDECVDFMARAVVEAMGSSMPGQPGKQERQDCAVSDIIVTNQELDGSFRVMGP
jgi:hypothetical protein